MIHCTHVCMPGWGPSTHLCEEREENPFLQRAASLLLTECWDRVVLRAPGSIRHPRPLSKAH